MQLYTFILDYAGGTYIEQVKATDENNAVLEWAKAFNVPEMHTHTVRALTKAFCATTSEEGPVALDGLMNAWCITAVVAHKLALMNIIKTENL